MGLPSWAASFRFSGDMASKLWGWGGTGMGVQKAPLMGSSWLGVLRDLGGAGPQGWTGLDLPVLCHLL